MTFLIILALRVYIFRTKKRVIQISLADLVSSMDAILFAAQNVTGQNEVPLTPGILISLLVRS